MDIKSVVLGEISKQVEASIPELQKRIEVLVIDTIQSKEFEKEWATAINKKINSLDFFSEISKSSMITPRIKSNG